MKNRIWIAMFAALLALTAVMPASADDLDAVKARMLQRRGEVQALLSSQAAGENNIGLLEKRGSVSGGQAGVIAAENADRSKVYAAIAAKAGADAGLVGRQRAAAIAEKAAPGTLVQRPDGAWQTK